MGTKPILALKASAHVYAEAVVGFQSANEAVASARGRVEVATNAPKHQTTDIGRMDGTV